MRSEEDKLVKIVLRSGQAINMYASPESIQDVMSYPGFVRFKDDGNDNILVAIDSMSAFEVLDDRRDPPKQSEGDLPELSSEQKD